MLALLSPQLTTEDVHLSETDHTFSLVSVKTYPKKLALLEENQRS